MNRPRLFRCDCPLRGPIVQLLKPTGDGYGHVKSLLRGTTYETRLDRLYPL